MSRHKIILIISIFIFGSGYFCSIGAEELELIPQTEENGLPSGWKPYEFKKIPLHTVYLLTSENGHVVIKAESHHSASGLFKRLEILPSRFPILTWRWKVENVLIRGDERSKGGDDYAARIYVTFKFRPEMASFLEKGTFGIYKALYGEYPPEGAINYIWANKLPRGESIASPYTQRSMMIAVESGKEKAGEWISEERNLEEDYRKLFGKDPPEISGIVLMTDTDNTGEDAIAYYGDVRLKTGK